MAKLGKFSNHAGWRVVNGARYYFKSRWEANYCRYLEFLRHHGKIQEWLYEPQAFYYETLRGVKKAYIPDFKILELDGQHWWAEVKGYLTPEAKSKIKQFAKHYPQEKLIIIDAKWFRSQNAKLKGIVPEWE